jgi:hypothetical protein
MSQAISNPSELQYVLDALSSATLRSARLPAQVFQPPYDRFRFLDFEYLRGTFWGMLQRLLEDSGDLSVNVIVLEPDPESFYADLGHFGAFQIPASASADAYRAEICSASPSSPVLLSVLVWFPPSLRWLIWGERDPEIMVFACRRGFDSPSDSSLEEAGMPLFTAEEVLERSSRMWGKHRTAMLRFAREFMDNYGGGRPWVDSAPERAIAGARRVLAGELGLIEGCRALSSMSREFETDMDDLFSPFVAIDSKARGLPVGAVRDLWEAEALARMDIEITRCEELYRAQALEACSRLIEHLQSNERRRKSDM